MAKIRRYTKKPIAVEAIEYDGTNAIQIQELIGAESVEIFHNDMIIIHTLEGGMQAKVGDYIIKGVRGEFYPCNGEIFAETYDPIKER